MKIIDKYVYAVTILLPEKNREDIKKELTSLIWDALEERSGDSEPDEKTAADIIKELGSPAEMSKKYTGEAVTVIGAGLTDSFWMVIRIVLPIMFILVAVGSAIDLAAEGFFSDKIIQWIMQTTASFVGAGINTFGVIAMVFAGITWVQRNKGEMITKKVWNPADLPEIPDSTANAKLSDLIANIAAALIGLQVFNFMADSIFFKIGGFNKAVLSAHLPLLNIALSTSLLFNILMLAKRRWTMIRRIENICFGGFVLYALAALFLDPNIFSLMSGQETVINSVTAGVRITIGIIGIIWISDSFNHLKNIIVKR